MTSVRYFIDEFDLIIRQDNIYYKMKSENLAIGFSIVIEQVVKVAADENSAN